MTDEIVRLQTIEFKQEIEKRFSKSRQNHFYVFEREGFDASDDDSLDSLKNIEVYNLCQPIRKKSIETERTIPKSSKNLLIQLLKPKKQPSFNENKSNNTSLYKSRSQSKNANTRLRTEFCLERIQKCHPHLSKITQESQLHSNRQPHQIYQESKCLQNQQLFLCYMIYINYQLKMSQKFKSPSIISKVHPKVLYNTQELNAKVIKVFSPFEYMHYIKRRQDYLNKQQELISNLQLSKENYEKLTFSVKQIGVTDDEGRVGALSQRKYLLKSMESTRLQKSESIQHSQTDRIQYQFRAKALQSSRREKTSISQQKSKLNFLTIPEKSETQLEFKTSNIDKIIKRSRQKKRFLQSQPQPPEVAFAKQYQNQKYLSYSRQLQELQGTLDFIKLL
ncbi:unnamed protein product [Paramecium primaurelia]|uniref:Uncharacterized protein n=1 Tax=Paramecium primaurelia TaxID=5886 RepID=A0A8S1PI32_PARPR|nr:unnamed protein product [Paramecium primaurelia]